MHAYELTDDSVVTRGGMTIEQYNRYMEEKRAGAELELSLFLDDLNCRFVDHVLMEDPAAESIRTCARQQEADLVVIGTHGASGMSRVLWGSVAQEVLRLADRDVLVVHRRPTRSQARSFALRLSARCNSRVAELFL